MSILNAIDERIQKQRKSVDVVVVVVVVACPIARKNNGCKRGRVVSPDINREGIIVTLTLLEKETFVSIKQSINLNILHHLSSSNQIVVVSLVDESSVTTISTSRPSHFYF